VAGENAFSAEKKGREKFFNQLPLAKSNENLVSDIICLSFFYLKGGDQKTFANNIYLTVFIEREYKTIS